jgi:DNA-binding CsgD family transcriptional regulator
VYGAAPTSGALVVFEGPAGGGKSALLGAACAMAETHRLRVLHAAGSELERGFPYGVVRQLLEPLLLGAKRSERNALLTGPARAAAGVLGIVPDGAESDYAVHHALFRLLVGLSATRPLLLAVDDLGLADEPSLDFLHYLAQRQAQHPVVTLATLTAGNGGSGPLPIGLLRIHQAAQVCRLEPLDEAGVGALLTVAGQPAPPAVCAELTWITAGNPFLVTSMIDRFIVDGPLLERMREPGAEALVPPEISRDLALRLARLPAEAGLLARTAAVLGEGASVTTAARLMDVRPAVVLDAVEALAGADVLRQSGVISFSAPLLRSVLYGMLAHGERSRMHTLAAHALWDDGAQPSEAAAHLVRADGSGDSWAVEVLRAAAGKASAPQAAAGYLRRALAEEPSEDVRAELLAELASAELSGGGSDAARHLAEAVALLPPGLHRAEAREQLGRVLWGLGRYAEAERAFGDGLADVGTEGGAVGPRLRAACLAAARLQRGVDQGGLARLQGAPAESYLHEPAMLAQLALELVLAGGPRDRVVELAESALAGGRLLSQQTCCGPAYQAAVCALVWADELDAAERAATLAIEDAQRRDIGPALGVMLLLRSCAWFRRGRLPEAQRDAEAATHLVPALLPVPVPPADALLAEIRLELGQLAGAREGARRAVDTTAARADETAAGKVQHALALATRGRVELSHGDPRQAMSDLLTCGDRLREAEVRNPAVAPWRSRAAIAALRLGDRDRAAALAEEERELAEAFGAPRPIGLALAAVATTTGDRSERGRDLGEAAAALERSPALLDRAHVLADLGGELRRRGHRRASRDALRSALDLAVRCGADVLAKRARQDLVATGARPRRTRISGADSLTPRERQIAELAAEGQTNRAIADRLIVSQKTIEWHLANAYRKLEIRGRAALGESLTES